MLEASARIGLDATTTPPRLVTTTEAEKQSNIHRKDVAEAFFPSADRWGVMGFPFFVLLIQTAVLFVAVGFVLLSKDLT